MEHKQRRDVQLACSVEIHFAGSIDCETFMIYGLSYRSGRAHRRPFFLSIPKIERLERQEENAINARAFGVSRFFRPHDSCHSILISLIDCVSLFYTEFWRLARSTHTGRLIRAFLPDNGRLRRLAHICARECANLCNAQKR